MTTKLAKIIKGTSSSIILIPVFKKISACLVLLIFIAAPVISQEQLNRKQTSELLSQAKQLVSTGKMNKAYKLLAPYETQLAGNVGYDYLLGTAALDSDHADIAVFVLERVIDIEPGFAGARLELARALFTLGENEKARYHFDYLLAENPPLNVQQVITSYLRTIERLSGAYKDIHIPSITVGFGYDSNANASTGDDQFLGFFLAGNNRETDSTYYSVSLADFYSHPLSPNTRLLLSGVIGQRSYPSADFVDARNIAASAGMEWKKGDTTVTSTLGAMKNWLDGDDNMHSIYGDIALSHSMSDTVKLFAGFRGGVARYADALDIRDADQYSVRFGAESYLDRATGTTIGISTMYSTDNTDDSLSPYESDRYGVTLTGSRIIGRGLMLGVDAGVSRLDYDGKVQFFGIDREDDMYSASASLHWIDFPAIGWRTSARIGYSDNDSNIDLYTYDRTEVGVVFHKAFE
jgi:outer membrane protein